MVQVGVAFRDAIVGDAVGEALHANPRASRVSFDGERDARPARTSRASRGSVGASRDARPTRKSRGSVGMSRDTRVGEDDASLAPSGYIATAARAVTAPPPGPPRHRAHRTKDGAIHENPPAGDMRANELTLPCVAAKRPLPPQPPQRASLSSSFVPSRATLDDTV